MLRVICLLPGNFVVTRYGHGVRLARLAIRTLSLPRYDEIVQTLFLIWLVLGIGGLLTLVALCIAPCVTPALFPDGDAEDDPKKYDEDPEASEASEAKEGDEPAWHGSSVEVDDLWPQTQEVSPRSMEL